MEDDSFFYSLPDLLPGYMVNELQQDLEPSLKKTDSSVSSLPSSENSVERKIKLSEIRNRIKKFVLSCPFDKDCKFISSVKQIQNFKVCLKDHMIRFHEDQLPSEILRIKKDLLDNYICPFCSNNFFIKQKLLNHSRKHLTLDQKILTGKIILFLENDIFSCHKAEDDEWWGKKINHEEAEKILNRKIRLW